MSPHYNPALVLVSIGIAIMASYVALDLTGRLYRARGPARWVWWLGGSVAMGTGIWSMHFVGMLAFHLPVSVRYDGTLVLLSVVVAVGASALALFVASRSVLPVPVLMVSGLLMGAAINGMHYIGMAAMRLPAAIVWRPVLVVASIVVAVTASLLALHQAFSLRRTGGGPFRWRRLGPAVLMGAAISGMHYTGMAAATFRAAPFAPAPGMLALHPTGVSLAVVAGTVLILSLALAGAAFEDRTRLLTRAQRAQHDAEVASRLKDEFLATLSHELRTPLNVIVGRADMLRRVAHDPAQVLDYAQTIGRNGQALSRLVEDLLDVSRITLGGMQLAWQPVDVPALVEVAAEGIRPAAEARGLRLTVQVNGAVTRVTGDPTRLQQVVLNLLTNAMKFTPRGGDIRVSVSTDEDYVVVEVRDTGQGIDAAFLPYVFDMFRQEQPGSLRPQGGLGIGLSVVQRLIELHGGKVSASSDGPGRGSAFVISLPIQTPVPATAPPSVESVQPGTLS